MAKFKGSNPPLENWLNELSFDDILKRGNLFADLRMDAAGVPREEEKAVMDIHGMRKFISAAMALLALAGCVSRESTYAPPNGNVAWARKDGRRMASNPALYEMGMRDKHSCEARASQGGALDFNVFSACMDEKGYYRRDLARGSVTALPTAAPVIAPPGASPPVTPAPASTLPLAPPPVATPPATAAPVIPPPVDTPPAEF
jgi:hypothetical protein